MSDDIARVWIRDFSDEEVRRLAEAIEDAHDTDQTILPVYVSSFGGDVYALFAMVDLIRSCDMPVATIAIGTAQSCGSALLAAGTRGHRYIAPSASIMVHDVTAAVPRSKLGDIESMIAQCRAERNRLFDLFAKSTGKTRKFWDGWITKRLERDGWLTPAEAVALGIADHIRVPRIRSVMTSKVVCE